MRRLHYHAARPVYFAITPGQHAALPLDGVPHALKVIEGVQAAFTIQGGMYETWLDK